MNDSTHRRRIVRTLMATALVVSLTGPAAALVEAEQGPVVAAEVGRVQQPPRPPRPAPTPRPAHEPGRTGPQKTDRTVHDVRLGPGGELDLGNVSGDIEISASKGAEARIEIVKTARAATDEEARELFDLVRVDVVERSNRVEVRTHYQPRGARGGGPRRHVNVAVAYNVTAPAGTRVRAQSVSGSITSTGIQGESSYESVSGAIRVTGGGRVAAAKSISGDVELIDTAMDSTFHASSASGSITLRRVKARRVDAGSISGAVVLDGVEAERIDAQTVSGSVRFGGPLRRDGRYGLRSHSGDVHVTVTGGTGFEVDGTTFSGSIRSDLPIEAHAGTGGAGRARALRGVHGGGGAVLELTTFSGSIVISK